MFRQKGQGIVEFAFVFPFFIFLLMALIYSSMMMFDYHTITDIARASAREASLVGAERYDDIRDKYYNKFSTESLLSKKNSLYTWEATDFEIKSSGTSTGELENSVIAEITLHRNDGFAIKMVRGILPDPLKVKYVFYDENGSTSTT